MKYLKHYNEANREDFKKIRDLFKLSRDPYGTEKKDTTKTDPRIVHLSIRLYKLFTQIGVVLDYEPTFRVSNIPGTKQQIRIGEGHYFNIKFNNIKENSVLDFLLTDTEKGVNSVSNREYEIAVNISCDTLSKEMPQITLGDVDEMWQKSINLIKEYLNKSGINTKMKGIINKLIDLNMNYDAKTMRSTPPIHIPDAMLMKILGKIADSKNGQVISNNIKINNIALYNSLMDLYKKIKETEHPLSNADISKSSDLTDMGYNDD